MSEPQSPDKPARLSRREFLKLSTLAGGLLLPKELFNLGRCSYVQHGDENIPEVVVSVDDCPDPKKVVSIVETGKKLGIPITLFPKGTSLTIQQDLWRGFKEQNVEIYNHTHHHTDLDERLTDEQIIAELRGWEECYKATFGQRVPSDSKVFRLPKNAGSKRDNLERLLKIGDRIGYIGIIGWTYPKWPQDELVKSLKDTESLNGAIVLTHASDFDENKDPNLLYKLAQVFREKGVRAVSLSHLHGVPNYKPLNDFNDQRIQGDRI